MDWSAAGRGGPRSHGRRQPFGCALRRAIRASVGSTEATSAQSASVSIRPTRATVTVESTMHPPFAAMMAVPFVPPFHALGPDVRPGYRMPSAVDKDRTRRTAESWRISGAASPMTALTRSASRTPAAVATGPAIKAPSGRSRLLQRTNGSSLRVAAAPAGGSPVGFPDCGPIQGESAASWSDSTCNCLRSSSVNRMYCVLVPSASTRMKP